MASNIPRDPRFDSSLALLRDGYTFIQKRCAQLNTDIFATRLMGKKTICLHGEEGAVLFYDPTKFIRQGAVPKRVQKTLLGEQGVQTLDGEAHRQRKQLFMSLMSRESIGNLMQVQGAAWQAAIQDWEQPNTIILFDEVAELLCRSACAWAGVPLSEKEVKSRTSDFIDMIDAFGAVGKRHNRGKEARQRAEKWIRGIIKKVRSGSLEVPENSAAYAIAMHHEPDGKPMERQVAAVELINVIRPIVAIAWYITFAALALHQHPDCRRKLESGEAGYMTWFVQEVRRYYPFTPNLGARVRESFDWKGFRFRKGTLVMLDVYGTLHDSRLWENPDVFRPERFQNWQGSRFDFIPQGGGNYSTGHRCAGEMITIETLKLALGFLTKAMAYQVPVQDLSINLARMPTLPLSGFKISNVKAKVLPVPVVSVPLEPIV